MSIISHNPDTVPAPVGGYSQGLEVRLAGRYLFISGQIPETSHGQVPQNFDEQCETVWNNLENVLATAGMTVANLVKVTTFLTGRDQVEANGAIRRRHLQGHRPALTVIIAQTLQPEWLLEIEAIAAAED